MTWEILLILSVIQGITEFLPISSSAHLILIPKFFSQIETGRNFDVSLHFGSLLAVLIYLRKDLFTILLDTLSKKRSEKKGFKLLINLIVSTIPVVIIGFAISYFKIDVIRTIEVIGWTTLIFGVLLGIADLNPKALKKLADIKLKDSMLIGLAQTIALIPGVSRSGIVMTSSLLMGFNRYEASKYSLLLSIPVIIAATSLESISLYMEKGFFFNNDMIIGVTVSFITALLTITLFMKWINKASLKIFVIYRVILGIMILIFSYS